MFDPVIISIVALFVSITNVWVTLFRRGTVRITKPAFIPFCYDLVGDKPKAKIFIRCLLFSTGKRGHVIENMFIMVRHGQTRQIFNVWGYGEGKLVKR